MFTILFHSSKTMREVTGRPACKPRFIHYAATLTSYLAGLDQATIAKTMEISAPLAAKTLKNARNWQKNGTTPAIDAFVGDMYSGLQSGTWSDDDRAYANDTMVILSGLYGLLRPFDGVSPYRLEIGYKFPDSPFDTLYSFWGDLLARALPPGRTIINTSSAEYTKVLFPYLPNARIITPKFLTVSPKTGEPIFVTVHAKIARGAYARWLIVNRIEDESKLTEFTDIGYEYEASMSTELEPVFVAKQFKGLGLSVRLK